MGKGCFINMGRRVVCNNDSYFKKYLYVNPLQLVIRLSNYMIMCVSFSLVSSVIKDSPRLPPSKAQAVLSTGPAENYSYKQSIINLFRSKPFILLLISYGENYSIQKWKILS